MKIGIITHYYKSDNYGGNLQAYALVAAVNKFNLQVEQISTTYYLEMKPLDNQLIDKNILYYLKKFIFRCKRKTLHILNINNRKKARDVYKIRKATFENFNQNTIPHSKREYTSKDIFECVSNYDAFITGSDQIWNPKWYFSPFFLEFVPNNKIKISYAASLGVTELTDKQKEVYKEHLSTFDAVSVREENAVDLLNNLSPVPVEHHLDPTLLLNRSDWDEVCSDRLIECDYMFCYFLGGVQKQRDLATAYAKKHNLKIVTLPYLLASYRKCDEKFGDYKLSKVGPEQWISLIKHAKIVFTDSFHACVFSGIYEQNYIVFERDEAKGMGSRIDTLLSLYECPERFCNTEEKERLEYIETLKPINYSTKLEKMEDLKEKSINYLKENLSKRKEEI